MELIGDRPVLQAADLGDYGAILPSAYFEADGVRHAYLVGFGQQPGDQKVFHATSTDGVAWTIDETDPFADLGLELSPPGPLAGSVLEADDGGWVMYLWGVPAPTTFGADIYRATAPSPGGPWVADPDPVLGHGESGSWDDRGIDFPAVIRTDDGYLMLYSGNGWEDTERSAIGLATSADGISWQRAPQNPVVTDELCGDTTPQAALPRLLQPEEGPMVLVWDAGRQARIATSEDGAAWTCSTEEPVLTAADVPNSEGIHTLAAALVDGEISVLIESLVSVDGVVGSEVWLARAWVGE